MPTSNCTLYIKSEDARYLQSTCLTQRVCAFVL